MKINYLFNLSLLALCLASTAAGAQGMQRVGPDTADQAPVAAPKFGAQPPAPKVAPANIINPFANSGSPMPTPMPMGAPQKADLVKESLDQIAPMNEEEILRTRKAVAGREAATNQALNPLAKPVMRTTRFDMGPGAVPEVIRITQTEGATVSFMDAAGRPWQVLSAENFHPAGLDIGRSGKYSIVISSKMYQTGGNVTVLLDGEVKVPLKVIAGGVGVLEVDYTVDIQIPKYLPGAPAQVAGVQRQLDLSIDDLMNYLMKTPPKEAKSLTVEGLPGALAWQAPSGRVMLRTDQMVFSPIPSRRQSSFDGMTVFDVPVAPYVLVALSDGQIVNVKISGFSLAQQESK